MQIPIEIDFHGMAGVPDAGDAVARHAAKLEQRFGRITACRVAIKGPGAHHRTGFYEVSVRLALPGGREVNVGQTVQADERYADLNFAIGDAFRRARRQLQDQVRRLQGQVKPHQGEPIGMVQHLDPDGEFGFIEAADGHEVYFHRNSVPNGGFGRLAVGARVTYCEEAGEKGPQASTVKPLGKHAMRR